MRENDKQIVNGVEELNNYMRVPIKRTFWESFKLCVYNSEEGTVFTRTGKQWSITGAFYLVFLSCLALFFALCMMGLKATINTHRPRYILDDSLIGTTPGLGIRPNTTSGKILIISYTQTNKTQVDYWIDKIDEYLAENKVNKSDFHPCTSGNGYGYNNSSPCVFIKLNRIFGWIPQVYNSTEGLPSEMPSDLKEKISSTNFSELNTVWLSCKPEIKTENIVGKINYYPSSIQGFPSHYYPYENNPDYVSPLVAVGIEILQHNKTIPIECRAWAKNINQDRREQRGVINFQILIND